MIKNLTHLTLVLLSCLVWCFSAKVEAQITITQTLTPAEIAQRLQGVGIAVTDVRIIRCHPTAQGGFDVIQPLDEIGAINLGNTGIVMASGNILTSPTIQVGAPATTTLSTDLPNPISPTGTTQLGLFPPGTTVNLDGDALLQALSGQSIFDVCHIEIDIIPEGNEIRFPFTFASEEYPTFVNTTFNDAFGFFLSGPHPLGGNYVDFNLAVVPGTATPVTINTINWGQAGGAGGCPATNPNFYYHNLAQVLCSNATPPNFPVSPNGTRIAYNGLTRNLVAEAEVVPCQTYTIKLKIADGGDGILDSGVFIEKIQSDLLNVNVPLTSWDGCGDLTYGVSRNVIDGNTINYTLDYSGSATLNGVVDATSLPTNFSITNNGSFNLTITPDYSLVNPNGDTLIVRLVGNSLCPGLPPVLYDSAVVILVPPLNIGPDQIACLNFPDPVEVFPNYNYYGTYTWTVTGANPQTFVGQNFSYIPTAPGVDEVVLVVNNGSGCIDTDTMIVQVFGSQVPLTIGADQILAVGEQTVLEANQVYTSYLWEDVSGGGNTFLTNDSVFVFTATTPGQFDIKLTVFSGFPTCETSDQVSIFVINNVDLGPDLEVCSNEVVTLDATDPFVPPIAQVSFQWFEDGVAIDGATSVTFSAPPYVAPTDAVLVKTYRVRRTVTLTSGAQNVSEDEVVVTYYPTPVIGANDTELCDDDVVTLDATLLNENVMNYATYVWYNAASYPIPLSTNAAVEVQLGSYIVEATTDVCFEAKLINVTCPNQELPVNAGFRPYRITLVGVAGYNRAELTWNPAEEDQRPVYYYEIFYGFTSSLQSVRIGTSTEPRFTVTGLLNGQRYQFAVRAVYKMNNEREVRSDFSNTVFVTPSVVLGTDEEKLSEKLSLFPNPNQGSFTLGWAAHLGEKAQVSLLNLAGQQIAPATTLQNGETISFQTLPNGLYIVVVKLGDTVLKQKVSVVR
jgi:hypothetical protein